jgi:hypothetical protein
LGNHGRPDESSFATEAHKVEFSSGQSEAAAQWPGAQNTLKSVEKTQSWHPAGESALTNFPVPDRN